MKKAMRCNVYCSLSNAKISASVIVHGNEKHQYRSRIFLLPLRDVPMKYILDSVEDGLQGIFPSEVDLMRGKMVSTT